MSEFVRADWKLKAQVVVKLRREKGQLFRYIWNSPSHCWLQPETSTICSNNVHIMSTKP